METKNEVKKACFYDHEFFMGRNYAPFIDAVGSAVLPAKKNDFAERLKNFLLEKSGESKAVLFNSVEEAYLLTVRHVRVCSESAFGVGRNEIIFLSKDAYDFVVPEILSEDKNAKFVQVDHVGNFISALSDKTCAVVLELFDGAGNQIYKKDFLEQISEICAVRNVVLIVDERKTAPMFTGDFFAFSSYGICPDAVIAGGNVYRAFSIGAALFSKKVKPLSYKKEVGTVACAGALALCEGAFKEKDIIAARSKRLGDALSICNKVKDYRVYGLKGYAETEDGKFFASALKDKGLKTGAVENRIIFNLPIGLSESEFEFGLNVLKDVLQGAVNPFDTDKI